MKQTFILTALLLGVTAGSAVAEGVKGKAKDAVDQNCTVGKAVKGTAMKSTVGVGNRCGVAETAKDVSDVDGKGKDVKKKVKN